MFDDQLRNHALKSCLTWESTIAPSPPDDGNCPSVVIASRRRPPLLGSTQGSDSDEDSVDSLNSSARGSNAVRRWSGPRNAFQSLFGYDMSSNDTNCNLSSGSEATSSSNSDADPDIDHDRRLPVTSTHLWTSQNTWPDQISHTTISHGPPGILHTSSWTPRMMMTGRSRVRHLVGHNCSPTDVCNFDQHSADTSGSVTSHVVSHSSPRHPLIDQPLHNDWRPPNSLPARLFHDISDIRMSISCISCPPSWDRIILDYAILQSNYGSTTSSEEVVQRRNISHIEDNEINLDPAITELTNRSLTTLNEPVRNGTTQTDTNNEYDFISRASTSRPSMDTQFATLIDIVRRPPLHYPELGPSDAISIASTHRSLEPTFFPVHVTSAMHSSDSYSHPCMTGPIVDRPMSHQDWHDEVCDWFGDESSVSSSYTNESSETSTSDTACISSSSLDLSQRDRSLTVTAMSPLCRSLSLIRLTETPDTCPLSTSSNVDPDTMNRPLTSSDMLSLRRTLSFSNLPEISHPPTHSSAASFTALTVEEGVSGSTNTHGTQSDHSSVHARSSV